MANKTKTLRVGDFFVWENISLKLIDVIGDNEGDIWAIALDEEGIPFVVSEEEIPDETASITVLLPQPKKGKK